MILLRRICEVPGIPLPAAGCEYRSSVWGTEPAESTVELKFPVRGSDPHRAAKPVLISFGLRSPHSSLPLLLLRVHSLQDEPERQQDPQSFVPIELFLPPLLIEFPTRPRSAIARSARCWASCRFSSAFLSRASKDARWLEARSAFC